jgi:hypothetical protein
MAAPTTNTTIQDPGQNLQFQLRPAVSVTINGQEYEFTVLMGGSKIANNDAWRNVAAKVAKLFEEKINASGQIIAPDSATLTLSGQFGSTPNPDDLSNSNLKVKEANYTAPQGQDGSAIVTSLTDSESAINELTQNFLSKFSNQPLIRPNAPSSTVPNTSNLRQTQNAQSGTNNTVDERDSIYDGRTLSEQPSLAHALVEQLAQMPERNGNSTYQYNNTSLTLNDKIKHLNNEIAATIKKNPEDFTDNVTEIQECLSHVALHENNNLPEANKREITALLTQDNLNPVQTKEIISYYCKYLQKESTLPKNIATNTYLKAFAKHYDTEFDINVKNVENGSTSHTLYSNGSLNTQQNNKIIKRSSCLFLCYENNKYYSLNRSGQDNNNLNADQISFQTKKPQPQTTNNAVGSNQQPQPLPQPALIPNTNLSLSTDQPRDLHTTLNSTDDSNFDSNNTNSTFNSFTSQPTFTSNSLLSTNNQTFIPTENANPTELVSTSINTHDNNVSTSSNSTTTPTTTNASDLLLNTTSPLDSNGETNL